MMALGCGERLVTRRGRYPDADRPAGVKIVPSRQSYNDSTRCSFGRTLLVALSFVDSANVSKIGEPGERRPELRTQREGAAVALRCLDDPPLLAQGRP